MLVDDLTQTFVQWRRVFYLKNSNPSKTDIVERDGSLERVVADCATNGIELVPVDALFGRRRVICRTVAEAASDRVCVSRQLRALGHAVVLRLAADEVAVAAVVICR